MTAEDQIAVARRAAEAGRFDRLVRIYRDSDDVSVVEGLACEEILDRVEVLLGEPALDEVGVVLAVLMSGQDGLGSARGYVGEAMARSRRRQKESPLR